MSNDPAAHAADDSPTAAPAKKPRNPVERIVVWVAIIAMLAVCGREAVARFGYTKSLNNLQAAVEADADGEVLSVDEIPNHISGGPTREEDAENRIISYTWSGLLKTYGTIHLTYDDEAAVLGLMTADAPPPVTAYAMDDDGTDGDESASAASASPDSEMASAGDPGEGGGQGGPGGRFNPMQFDADGDGKLSREEAPERMQEQFAEIDTNGDGFADEAELEVRRAAFRQRRGQGGEGAESGRPQRPTENEAPAAEETPETESPATDAPADPAEETPAASATEDSAASDNTEEKSNAEADAEE